MKENENAARPGPQKWDPVVFLATGAYVGRIPVAPGTFGALWGLPLAWLISQIASVPVQAVILVALFAVGVPLCTAAAKRLGQKDPSAVVWDEIASVPIAFFLIPTEAMSRPAVLVTGFVLIRILDIAKPTPIRQLERLPEGLGIMADDAAAGAFACLILHWIVNLNPWGLMGG